MAPEPHFQEVVSILRHRRWAIIAVTVIGTTLVLLGSMMIPPRYTATAQIVVETGPAYPGDSNRDAGQSQQEAIVQTHITALTARAQLERVLDSLAHDRRYREAGAQPPSGMRQAAAALWHQYGAPLWGRVARFVPSFVGKAGPPPSAAKAAAARVEGFRRSLKVSQKGGSHVIAVAFTSVSPDVAALAANRVAELYVKGEEDWRIAQVNRVVGWLDERIPSIKSGYNQAETAVQNYRVAHGLADPARTSLSDQKLADLTGQLVSAEADLAKRRAELSAVRGSQQGADSPAVAALRQQENVLLQSQAEAAVTLGENHPKVQQLEAQLRVVRQKLADEAGRTVGGLARDVQVAQDQVSAIRGRLAELRTAGSQAQEAEPRLNELEREAAATGQVYQSLLQRREQLRTQQEVVQPALRILSLAAPPDRPSSSSRLLFVLPALIMFSIGGSLLAVAAERLQKGMRSAQDINDALGIPCIGFVPLIRHRGGVRPHQYLLQNPFAAYTEAIRSIVAALQLTSPARPPRVILITSSMPNEGKTTLAVSLAVYFALIGRRALLIDLDFRHPAVGRELGQINSGGRDAVLPDAQSWQGTVRQVPGLHLDYLPVPADPGDPLVPVVGGSVSTLLAQLRDSYDCIVIDSPPLLAVAEARLLVALADQVLLAVQWGRTHRVVAQDALALLRDHGQLGEDVSDRVGAVVTQVDLKKHTQYRYGGLESLRVIPPPRPPRPVGQVTRADPGGALPFAGAAAVEPPPDSAAAPPALGAPLLRREPGRGRQIGVLLLLCVAILVVPAATLTSLVQPRGQKIAALDPPRHVAGQGGSSSQGGSSTQRGALKGNAPPAAGKAPAAAIPGRDAANRALLPKAVEVAAAASPEPRPAKDRAPPPARAAPATRQGSAAGVAIPTAPRSKPVPATSGPATAAAKPATQPAEPAPIAAAPATAKAGPSLSPAEISSLVARGDAFVELRDIATARLFYLRAAEAGDGRAATRMAVTFDPAFLDRVNLSGFGNPRQALGWYQRARDLGQTEAGSAAQKFRTP